MHMEEIDLCWRLHAAGFTVRSVPAAVVWHEGGHSLAQESFKKARLNHRNALVLLLKNWTGPEILLLFPARVAFELGTMIYGLTRRDWKHPTAALLALLWVITHPVAILRRRARAKAVRRVSARDVARSVYPGSVAWQRFVRGVRTVAELPEFVTTPALGPEDAGRLAPVHGKQPQQLATEHVNAGAAQTREAEAGAL